MLYGGYDGQAAARRLRWSRYLKGGLRLLRGRAAEATQGLQHAGEYFASDDEGGRRALARNVLTRAVQRSEGSPNASEIPLPSIRLAVFEQLRKSDDIEVAEAATASGDLDLALRKYESLARRVERPMVSIAALIGLAEVSVTAGPTAPWGRQRGRATGPAVRFPASRSGGHHHLVPGRATESG